jgi:hypothetical protein
MHIQGRKEATISLFLPDQTLGVVNNAAPIRFQLRFFNAKQEHINALDVTLPPMSTQTVRAEVNVVTRLTPPQTEAKGPVFIYDTKGGKYKDYDD